MEKLIKSVVALDIVLDKEHAIKDEIGGKSHLKATAEKQTIEDKKVVYNHLTFNFWEKKADFVFDLISKATYIVCSMKGTLISQTEKIINNNKHVEMHVAVTNIMITNDGQPHNIPKLLKHMESKQIERLLEKGEAHP